MASSDELRRKNRKREDVADKNLDDDGDLSTNNSVTSSNPEVSDKGLSSVESGETEQWPRYGMISVCGRRRDMEDAVSIRPDFMKAPKKHHFFGVFDGHGCSHVRIGSNLSHNCFILFYFIFFVELISDC